MISAIAARSDLALARALVFAHGRNATCYQILNPGIHRWFSPEDDAVVGFVPAAGVRVVAGAPICPRGRLAEVVAAFEDDTSARGQRACYFGAEEPLAEVLRARGPCDRLVLGGQPMWSPESLVAAFAGKASLRAQLHRARNKGVVAHRWPSEEATGHPGLARCLAEWLATRGLPPMQFLVEPETLARLEDRRVFVAERHARGAVEPLAFLVASPIPRRHGWLIEQIVRGTNAINGTNELLLHQAALELAAHGARFLTLGLSPLSRRAAPAHVETPIAIRAILGAARAWGRSFYDFEGLEAFKAKFLPDAWEPIYAIAAERRFRLRTLWAIAGAFGGTSPLRFVARGALRSVTKALRGAEIDRSTPAPQDE